MILACRSMLARGCLDLKLHVLKFINGLMNPM